MLSKVNSSGNISLEQLVEFVWNNKRKNAWRDRTREQIEAIMARAIHERAIVVDVGTNSQILGVGIGEIAWEYKVVHVSQIIAVTRDSLRRMAMKFRELWPGFDIQATRHDNLIRYKNTQRLLDKLIA